MAPKTKFSIPGVAEGQKVVAVPTGNVTAMERVNALLQGSMSEEMYQVSSTILYPTPALPFVLPTVPSL